MPEQTIALRVAIDADEAVQVITRFLKDYFEGAKRQRAVVGVSGGLDSAVAAALATRALGVENVHGLVLPSAATTPADLDDAAAVIGQLGIASETLPIADVVASLETAWSGFDEVGRANATARARMILLHEAARRQGALVLGTGNKSELLCGYFSKYGDGGVDVQPLGDLYKTQVRQVAEHLGLPETVRSKPPSAGLWAGQTDEAELGLPYDVLDRVLLGLEIRFPHEVIADAVAVDVSEVDRVAALRASTHHKRRVPLAPKFGLRTAGVDWRTYTVR